MSTLAVPTLDVVVEIVTTGGRVLKGRIFLSVGSQHHPGPMHVEEWINEGPGFFPFAAEEDRSPVLLNKRHVLLLTVPVSSTEQPVVAPHRRRVVVELGSRRIEGVIEIELPEDRGRVLDFLNNPGAFFAIREGARHHLVQKGEVHRAIDLGEA